MKIGILGAGNIGGSLGKHFSKAGHEVYLSSRHPGQIQDLAKEIDAQCGTVEQAIAFGEVILLAVPFQALEKVAEQGDFEDKIVIDATNPYPGRDGDIAEEALKENTTASEYAAQFFPDSRLVKAFNSVYYKTFQEKAFRQGDERIAVHLCSDDEKAKEVVSDLIEDIGMAPMDFGALKAGEHFQPGAPMYNTNLNIRDAREFWNMVKDRDSGEQRKAA